MIKPNFVVGIAEMKICSQKDELLVTYALGSCLGVSIYDPEACLGGLLHAMLPSAHDTAPKGSLKEGPCAYVDTGLTLLFRQLCAAGAQKSRLVVKVAGGAAMCPGEHDFFAVGRRNFILCRKWLWQNGIMLSGQDVGGTISRTLYLEIGTGRTWLQSNGKSWDI